jgi:fructose-1,6-bisphosphatase I
MDMNIKREILTLEEFRKQELRLLPNATGELSNLLRDIALASKRVNVEVNKAGLADIFGPTGLTNIQNESVQKLDELANRHFITALRRGVSCAGIASEELDDFLAFDEVRCNESKYVVVIDPLDGSSNIDVNISIGTIFGVFRRKSQRGAPCTREDFFQKGEQLLAAGYIIYGSSTMLVYATRRGVNGFTLDPSIGEYTLSHPDIRCPVDGRCYSVNQGNFFGFEKTIQEYLTGCQHKLIIDGGSWYQRYTGSLVADMHRNLLKGGIFLYPATMENPKGKLRLVYECNPFAFILSVAGGEATDGKNKILELEPGSLHGRTPFFAGSKFLMESFSNTNRI